jgi:sarcosine oxidase subunit beta
MKSADVVVIGGGVIGAAITYNLAVCGVEVTLVERGELASGTSGACGGSIAIQTKGAGPVLECARFSQQLYRTLADELGQDLEHEQQGSVIVAESDDELRHIMALAAVQQAAGLDIELLDGPDARAWAPGLGPSVRAASFCAGDAEVNPFRVVLAFAEAAQQNGAQLRTHTQVTGIDVAQGRVTRVRTEHGDIGAGAVVIAAGAWTPTIGRMVGVNIPVRPRRGVVIVTEPAPFRVRGTVFSSRYLASKRYLPDETTTVPDTESGFTGGLVLSQAAAGNVIFGSSRELAGYDVAAPIEIVEFVAREALRIVPVIAQVRMIRSFAGLRPLSNDGLPIIGRVSGICGLVVATGHEGDGVALAPWTGQAVATLIVTGEPPLALRPFDPDRIVHVATGSDAGMATP